MVSNGKVSKFQNWELLLRLRRWLCVSILVEDFTIVQPFPGGVVKKKYCIYSMTIFSKQLIEKCAISFSNFIGKVIAAQDKKRFNLKR